MTITIYDQDGNIYNDENNAIAAIDFVVTDEIGEGSVVVGREVVARKGKFNFPALTLRMKPDSTGYIRIVFTDLNVF